MTRPPLEVLNDHLIDSYAHHLHLKWETLQRSFKRHEDLIQKNADAIAALTERFEHHAHDSLEATDEQSKRVERPGLLQAAYEAYDLLSKSHDPKNERYRFPGYELIDQVRRLLADVLRVDEELGR